MKKTLITAALAATAFTAPAARADTIDVATVKCSDLASMNEDEVVAKVAGRKVTTSEMDNAHRNLVERARAQQPELDASRLDAPEIKRQALDLLVNDYVLMAAANDQKLRASDSRVLRLFASADGFAALRVEQSERDWDHERFLGWLAGGGGAALAQRQGVTARLGVI